MREILFRGKREDNGEWVEGFYVCISGVCHYILTGNPVISPREITIEYYKVIPETVGLYTGKELDGIKIFTGDIVESCVDYDDIFGYPATDVFKSVAIWDEENFCFAFKTDDYIQPFNDWDWDYCGVIGNIHNAELYAIDDFKNHGYGETI